MKASSAIDTLASARDLATVFLRSGSTTKLHIIGSVSALLRGRLNEGGASVEEFDPDTTKDDLLTGTVVVLDLFSELNDIWKFLRKLRGRMSADTPCILVHTSWYWRFLNDIIQRWTSGRSSKPKSWLSHMDIANLVDLNGFEIVSFEDRLIWPWQTPLIEPLFNRFLVKLPLFHALGQRRIYFLRSRPDWNAKTPAPGSVSIIVPCRNERGNIARCIEEMPTLGTFTEIIFVEGGSNDDTANEIQRQIDQYQGPLRLKVIQQDNPDGKGGAVRLGFEMAQGEILMILDADLTVPPKELEKFYLAIVERQGEFIMGSRLVYPMEEQAMRTLNILGNKTFSLIFSWLLDRPIKDTLCGTKVLRKADYEKIRNRREAFGLKDPFGDFDLIFGAALQNFKIVEIPVRYKARTYGQTNISRFRHGWLLLQMCGAAFRRLKMNG